MNRKRQAVAAALAVLAAPTVSAAQDRLIGRDRPDRNPDLTAPARDEVRPESPEAPAHEPFVLRAVTIEGSSLPPARLQAVTEPFIGRTMDREALVELQRALALAYADSQVALPLARLDLSRAGEGVLGVAITEASVSAVRITGDTDGDIDLLRHYAARLTVERPLSRATSERYLSLMSDIPGAEIRANLTPGPDGQAVLNLGLERRAWDSIVTFDNRGSRTLGRTQVGLTLERNGLFRLGDQTRLGLTVPTDLERFQYLTFSHRQPVGFDGADVTATVGYLRTRPEAGLDGDALSAGLYLSWPAIRGYRTNLVLSGGVDGIDSDNAVLGELISSERTRAARVSAAWSHSEPTSSRSAALVLSHGLDALGAGLSQPGLAELDFFKANLRLRWSRTFDRLRLTATAAGQHAESALPASEFFSIGGGEFGRAFPSALIAGDTGWGAAVEAAWRPAFLPARLDGSEVYVFADGGEVGVNDRPGLPAESLDLASAGLGVRLAVRDRGVLEVEGARALVDPRPAGGDAWRISFALTARF